MGKLIDVAVCSHSDIDHAGGFPTFVETWVSEGNEIGEFWLPALWSPALPDVLINPDRLVGRLRDGATQAAKELLIVKSSPAADIRSFVLSGERDLQLVEQSLRKAGRSRLQERRDSLLKADIAQGSGDLSREAATALSLGLTLQGMQSVRASLEESDFVSIPLSARTISGGNLDHWLFSDGAEHQLMEQFQIANTFLASVVKTAETI
ncbi:hypothetical protein NKK48_29085 [Mesorhizobium sp. C386A]|uniref:hypothetical protein n=1 Tax=unclassified Mesorhizobium TaxID=325217 RepID=UPI0003CF1F59|nr:MULTISPECIES: hypothetical protein [unclassified Mesorhizobium]ESY09158.1 hypothetical protein X752_21130 [Mesorhizobium sp. LNJC398B00]ESY32066.1 hypothetical protein X748_24140 [Mesorhizobium sp. LNJC386A00]